MGRAAPAPFQEQEVNVSRTFVDENRLPLQTILEGFYVERRVRSCPPIMGFETRSKAAPKAPAWRPSLAAMPCSRAAVACAELLCKPAGATGRARSAAARPATATATPFRYQPPDPAVVAQRPWHMKRALAASVRKPRPRSREPAERCTWTPKLRGTELQLPLPRPKLEREPRVTFLTDEPWDEPKRGGLSPTASTADAASSWDAITEVDEVEAAPVEELEREWRSRSWAAITEEDEVETVASSLPATPEPSPRALCRLLPPPPVVSGSLEEAKQALKPPRHEASVAVPEDLHRARAVRAPRQHLSLLPTWSPEPSLESAPLPPPPAEQAPPPTIGSVGHWAGSCRPCAFMTKGCVVGWSCPFCHLCDPNERLRRKRLRKKAYRLGLPVDEATGLPSPEAHAAILHLSALRTASQGPPRA